MANKNPYHLRGMIPIESGMFFGREKELRRITGMLSGDTPQCVSIIGERRIGKSSVAIRVCHELRQMQNTLAVYLDCDGLAEGCQSKDLFFQSLNRKFVEALEQTPGNRMLVENGTKKLFGNYSSFMTFISNRGKKNMKTIIFLDEFEHLPHDENQNKNKFADDTFFSNLRAMANDPANRLAYVAISKTNLKELTHRSIRSSGFWNIFQVEPLGLLNPKSIDDLRSSGFANTSFSLTNGEIDKLHYYGGDFPFFNQMVCGFLWDAKMIDDEPDWDDAAAKLLPFYEKLWEDRSREEQMLLKHLKGKENMALIEMKSRGVIIKKENHYLAFCGYFSYLIDKHLEIRQEMLSENGIIRKIKEGLDILKKGRDVIKGD